MTSDTGGWTCGVCGKFVKSDTIHICPSFETIQDDRRVPMASKRSIFFIAFAVCLTLLYAEFNRAEAG